MLIYQEVSICPMVIVAALLRFEERLCGLLSPGVSHMSHGDWFSR